MLCSAISALTRVFDALTHWMTFPIALTDPLE
jgi:hypothetical protein